MGQVNWTDTARRHLEKIYGYLSDQSVKNYRIVYQIRLNSRDINILAVLHCSRDVKKAFLKR